MTAGTLLICRPCRLLAAGIAAVVALAMLSLGAGGLLAQDAQSPDRPIYPTPSIAPVAWQIDLRYRTPRRIVVESGQGSPKAYWYMIYTVTNNADQELFFVPEIAMLTSDGRVIPANRNIPLSVFDAIQRRARGMSLSRPQEMTARLLVGEDFARSSVAIWEEPMPRMGTFDIFIGGLSGEVRILQDGNGEALKDDDGNPIRVRKTRHLRFKIRGDDVRQELDEVVQVSDTWVMR